jgi:hypothetical protein
MGYGAYKRARNGKFRRYSGVRKRSSFRRFRRRFGGSRSRYSRHPTAVYRKAGPTWLPHRGYLSSKRGRTRLDANGYLGKAVHTGMAIGAHQLASAIKRARRDAIYDSAPPLLPAPFPDPSEDTYTVTFPDEL